jgi:hypothetical protein
MKKIAILGLSAILVGFALDAEMCPDCPRGKKGKHKGRRKKPADDDNE